MNPRTRDLNLIIEHFREQAWFKTDLKAFLAAKEERNAKAAKMAAREAEWLGLPPVQQKMVLAQIKKEIDNPPPPPEEE